MSVLAFASTAWADQDQPPPPEARWWAFGEVVKVRATVTAERHLVLDLATGPLTLCVSNVLDRRWRVEAFEDAVRAGTASYAAANEPVPSALTALATLSLDY